MRHNRVRGIFLALLSLAGLVFFPLMIHNVAASTLWGSPTAVETNAGINILNSGLLTNNGTMWLAWQTNRYRGDSQYDISYKTNTNGVWSPAHRLTTAGANAGAALAQLSNGTILLFWAYKVAASYLIYYKTYNNPVGWSDPTQATSTSLNDTNPSAAVGRDGTLWLVWTRTDNTCTSCTNPPMQLYYKTLKSGVWSAETQLTSDTNQNWGSGVAVSKDNVVRVVWSKGLGSLENYQVYYKTYNGVSWSTETRVVTSTNSDEHPSIMQDRNGTMWLFWQRKIYTSGLTFHYVLDTKYSYDGGITWPTPESQITNSPTNVDSMQPFGVQSSYDKSIYAFYTTNPTGGEDIYALISSPIQPIHDVTITAVTASTQIEYPGGLASVGQSAIVSFTVIVLNRGDQSEIVTVALTVYNSSSYSPATKQNLATPGGTANLVFSLNTTNWKPGWYAAAAYVSPVPGESIGNQADNNVTFTRVVHVIPVGDVDQDGSVSIVDVAVFFYNYGFTPATPSRWNPYCDINNNGIIDIVDVSVAARAFGATS
jgi:hypothetical protein